MAGLLDLHESALKTAWEDWLSDYGGDAAMARFKMLASLEDEEQEIANQRGWYVYLEQVGRIRRWAVEAGAPPLPAGELPVRAW
jgi:hypothetical protein